MSCRQSGGGLHSFDLTAKQLQQEKANEETEEIQETQQDHDH